MKSMEIHKIAEQLIGELKQYGWSDHSLPIWLRDKGVCQYCGRNLRESYDVCYHMSNIDHLLPQKEYGWLEKAYSNQVLSCKPCNTLKSTWDANKKGGEPVYLRSDGAELSESQRQVLIDRCRTYLDEAREKADEKLVNTLEILRKKTPWVFPDEG